jgi:hypothetical protein
MQSLQPFRNFYVDVPPSPYTISPAPSLSTTRKENDPWRSNPAMEGSTVTASASLKRKIPYPEHPLQPYMAVLKKPKLVADPAIPAPSDVVANAYIYCHQCGKKRDKEGILVLCARSSHLLIKCTLKTAHTARTSRFTLWPRTVHPRRVAAIINTANNVSRIDTTKI